MDDLKKLKAERRPLRSVVTRMVNECNTLLQQTPLDKVTLSANVTVLQEYKSKMTDLDERIMALMLVEVTQREEDSADEDEEINEHILDETVKSSEYKKKIAQVIVGFEAAVTPEYNIPNPPQSMHGEDDDYRKFRLPKIQMRQFSGEILDWLPFWSQFKSIHEDQKLKKVDKFTYLIQSLVKGSKAYETVSKYNVTEENYDTVINVLKSSYGDEDTLVQVYVRELLHLQSKNEQKFEDLWETEKAFVRNLKSLNQEKLSPDLWIYLILESNVPKDIRLRWQLHQPVHKEGAEQKTELECFTEFVDTQLKAMKKVELAQYPVKKEKKQDHNSEPRSRDKRTPFREKRGSRFSFDDTEVPTAMGLVSLEQKGGCALCSKNHSTQDCYASKKMSYEEIHEKLKRSRRCFICLKGGHYAKGCTASIKCKSCGGRHFAILCSPEKRKNMETKQEVSPSPSPSVEASCANMACTEDVILPTLTVKLIGANGKKKRVRVGVDCFSQHSYIRRSLAKELGYIPTGRTFFKHAVFGGSVEMKPHSMYQVHLSSVISSYSCKLMVYDDDEITAGIPAEIPKEAFHELLQFGVSRSEVSNNHGKIELLLGSNYMGRILKGKILQLKCGATAFETHFGWFMTGETSSLEKRSSDFTVTSLVNVLSPSVLWELESIGIRDSIEKKSRAEQDEETLKHFRSTVCRKEDGRYEVALPWVDGHPPLPNNKTIAEKRLQTVTKKLVKENYLKDYHAVFQEWKELEIIEEVTVEEKEQDLIHYLPHRPVIKLDSATTKIRPVFDASCSVGSPELVCSSWRSSQWKQTGISLNACLAKGPNLLEMIPDLLLRFREQPVAVTADIKKAFLMISVKPEDRDVLRFLWWKDEEGKQITVLRHCRVVFGVNCSPFLLGAVIEQHIKTTTESEFADKFLRSLYVDNLVVSFSSKNVYLQFKKKAIDAMSNAKFDLRMWESNVDEEFSSPVTNLLGMKWNREQDTIFCAIRKEEEDTLTLFGKGTITKRDILSAIARLYDPLGIMAPVSLLVKRMMQQCWELKLGWSDPVTEKIKIEFQKWNEELPLITYCQLKRYMGVPSKNDSVHVFCDASEHGYAAVAYLRKEDNDGIQLSFIMAKSRVAPLGKLTINRLELISCEIATRLARTIKDALGWNNIRFVYWTDSSTARAWIRRNDQWGTFVGNRVKKILEQSEPNDWNHVPGASNPADLPSRGCKVKFLLMSNWWEGPRWLKMDSMFWPTWKEEENEEEIKREMKKLALSTLVDVVDDPWYKRYSNYNRLVRIVAWILRFWNNSRKIDRTRGKLTLDEIKAAENNLFIYIQNEMKQEKISVDVIKDEKGLLRARTKLTHQLFEEDFRQPIVLPGNHYVTELMIRKYHLINHHAGVQYLIGVLRERVWITGCRRAVEKVIRNCVVCKRYKLKSPNPPCAPLPENRIRDGLPFEIVGIDYAGPLYLKNGRKTWIALYTCALYRAIHLELVNSLSTECFLLSFRRFIARRGRPTIVYTDNGTNFVGASRLLKEIDWDKIKNNGEKMEIKWIFNPPSAPWWGGWWERLVRTVKELLVRNLGKRVLEQEEMVTILCDVEAVVNDRPLTYVYEGDTLIPLKPSMFLTGVKSFSVPDMDQLDQRKFKKRYQFRIQLMRTLRQRFNKEYLGFLMQRRRDTTDIQLKIGDAVLIGNDIQKRVTWLMGVIIEIYPGKDGEIRVAKLKTAKGILVRPVQRLYPLEIVNGNEKKEESKKIEEGKSENDGICLCRTRYGRIIKKPVMFQTE